MEWLREKLLGLRDFNDLADVHDDNPIADILDHAQVVGNEEVCQIDFFLQVLDQIQDLGADRVIQSGDGLIGDNQAGVEGERACDAYALALAAAEGVRIAAHSIFRQHEYSRGAYSCQYSDRKSLFLNSDWQFEA